MTAKGKPGEGPEETQLLDEQIEQTRERLGETVEALVAKADVKARARQKVTEVRGRVTTASGEAREKLATVASAAPEPVRRTARTSAEQARRRRGPLALAAAVLGLVWLVARRRHR